MRPRYGDTLRFFLYRTTLLALFTGVPHCLPAQDFSDSILSLSESSNATALPDAPQPQSPQDTPLKPSPSTASPATPLPAPAKECPPKVSQASESGNALTAGATQKNPGGPCPAKFDIFYPLGKPPAKGRLSSMDKLRIASSNVVDPFNLTTIGISAAITIGSNPDTDYGPGMKGWAKNAGTLLTEDMSGAFFVTFLVPSLARQDPRYYRMPHASIRRRIANAIIHPVWTKSDNGNPMPNLADFLGIPATIALANVYVPGRKQGIGSIAESSAIAIASAPIDSLTTEFLPDVAKHFKIRIVLIQQIVNHIAVTGGQE